MDEDEFDWNREGVPLVEIDNPVRVASSQSNGGCWYIEGLETAGPNYHRPGFTEVIAERYVERVPESEEEAALQAVMDFIRSLSWTR